MWTGHLTSLYLADTNPVRVPYLFDDPDLDTLLFINEHFLPWQVEGSTLEIWDRGVCIHQPDRCVPIPTFFDPIVRIHDQYSFTGEMGIKITNRLSVLDEIMF